MTNKYINENFSGYIKTILAERKKILLKRISNADSINDTTVLVRLAELEFLEDYILNYPEYSNHTIHILNPNLNATIEKNEDFI